VSETPGIVREIEGQLRQVGRNSIRLIDDARGETVNSIVDILRGEQNSGRGRAATIDLPVQLGNVIGLRAVRAR
jgi:hypothetical protein